MIKRTFVGGLLGALGLAKSAEAQTMVDPRTILFSMPTITNDAPPLAPLTGTPRASDVAMHEDEWRQLEFFSADQAPAIETALRELKAFEAEHRTQSGWRQIYIRRLETAPVLSGADRVTELATLLRAHVEAGPIVYHGADTIDGRVLAGFSILLGRGAALYGFQDATGIPVLGAHLQNADDQLLTNAFLTINRAYGLMLVDWRAQLLLLSVEANGQIAFWRP